MYYLTVHFAFQCANYVTNVIDFIRGSVAVFELQWLTVVYAVCVILATGTVQ